MKTTWHPQKPPFAEYKKKVFQKAGAVSDFIYQIGEHSSLREQSKEVDMSTISTKEFQEKVTYLKECLLKYRKLTGAGRGITAVQVGIPERFSVIYMPERKDQLMLIINPVIVRTSEKSLKYPEICMSACPIIAPTIRPAWVEFEYIDQDGVKQKWDTTDDNKEGRLYNRVFQHEIDHMNGIINIDRVNASELILESDPNFYDKATFEEI